MQVLGIMSGTSIDGVDYALCDVVGDEVTSPPSIRLIDHWSRSFPASLQSRLHAAASNQCGSYEVAQLHHDLGRLYARQAIQLKCRPQLIGLHGQTIFHNPARSSRGNETPSVSRRKHSLGMQFPRSSTTAPATFQIGEPAYLAAALRVPVVSNFRAADIAAGGQGAPLAAMFHKFVFAQRGQHICVNNIGGISNVTSLQWRNGVKPRVIAFDTGPGNVLLDMAARALSGGRLKCDKNGALASSGRVHERLLESWLDHPYFRQRPPKSTGRELFGEPFWRTIEAKFRKAKVQAADILATLTEFTAGSISQSYRLHLPTAPDQVVLCGGGANNSELVRRLKQSLPSTSFVSCKHLGWPTESIEASAFALLAWLRMQHLPGNIPETTGARCPVLLGNLTNSL